MEKEIGKVIHYYDRAGVAVIRLSDALNVGDTVKFKKGETEFEETIDSMEVEHQAIESAQAGQEVAVKVSQKAREGTAVLQ
ncbi:MAG: hypothetical protein AAB604_00860 [Patescibacteria group bacterium]|jgi:hypothetical protein